MKVIKNINNNVAICVDSNGNEVVAFSKGIGFKKPPYMINIKNIERTFYHVDYRFLELIKNEREEVLDVAMEIKKYADFLGIITSNNLFFSLVDHISFAIKRQEKGIIFNLPIKDDIRYKFENEMKVGKYALTIIHRKLGVLLPSDEACYIALNIINSVTEASDKQEKERQTIERISEVISSEMGVDIDKESVNYSRFCSHMHYLINRSDFSSKDNYNELLQTVIKKNKEIYQCSLKVKEFFEDALSKKLNNDEVLFLSLHISRLCQRQEN